jgi:hypothetical protein
MPSRISGETRTVKATAASSAAFFGITASPTKTRLHHFGVELVVSLVHHDGVESAPYQNEGCHSMTSNLEHERNGQPWEQAVPAWAVTLLADMKARKAAAAPVVLPAGLRAAAARQQARQRTKGHGSHYGAAKFTGAW